MGATTPVLKLRYPTQTDAPDAPTQFKALAEDTEAYLTGGTMGDSAVQTTGLSVAVGAGFTLNGYTYRVKNSILTILFDVSRTGATITANADGNITNTTLLTLNTAAYRPVIQLSSTAYLSSVGAAGAAVLQTSGILQLISIQPSGTIISGNTIRANFTYQI